MSHEILPYRFRADGTIDDVLQKSPAVSAPRHQWATWLRRDLPHWWLPAVIGLAAAYLLLTLLVLAGSGFTEVDSWVYDLHLVPVDSPWRLPVQLWVFLGQRATAMVIAGLFVLWRVYRTRSMMPLVMYGVAAFGFVSSVLLVKYLTGRVGPRYTDVAHTVWDGGNIFPSGHVTGTVVMYGLIAMLATHAYRRPLTIVAVVLAVTVGAGTTALNLHWTSDVVAAWFDGALVLLFTWALAPHVHELVTSHGRRLRDWHRRTAAAGSALPFDTTALRQAHPSAGKQQ